MIIDLPTALCAANPWTEKKTVVLKQEFKVLAYICSGSNHCASSVTANHMFLPFWPVWIYGGPESVRTDRAFNAASLATYCLLLLLLSGGCNAGVLLHVGVSNPTAAGSGWQFHPRRRRWQLQEEVEKAAAVAEKWCVFMLKVIRLCWMILTMEEDVHWLTDNVYIH